MMLKVDIMIIPYICILLTIVFLNLVDCLEYIKDNYENYQETTYKGKTLKVERFEDNTCNGPLETEDLKKILDLTTQLPGVDSGSMSDATHNADYVAYSAMVSFFK